MSDQPLVPKGVLKGITDLANGNVATEEEIREVLKFNE